MNYASLNTSDIANGTGVRVSLFVSGCTNHCKGCFNEQAWDFDYGHEFTDFETDMILELLKRPYIKGLSILGGEPLHQRNIEAVVDLVKLVKEKAPDKDIWCWTGFTFEDLLRDESKEGFMWEFLTNIDVLVDGPFIEEQKDLSLKFRGSSNQRLIDVKKSFARGDVVLV